MRFCNFLLRVDNKREAAIDDFREDIKNLVEFVQRFADDYLKATNDVANYEKEHEMVENKSDNG